MRMTGAYMYHQPIATVLMLPFLSVLMLTVQVHILLTANNPYGLFGTGVKIRDSSMVFCCWKLHITSMAWAILRDLSPHVPCMYPN